jgi:hypothetical protein
MPGLCGFSLTEGWLQGYMGGRYCARRWTAGPDRSGRGSIATSGSQLKSTTAEGTVYSGWTRLLTRIRKVIGQAETKRDARYTLHDNRRSFTTLLAERFDENLLDLMIAHRPASRKGSGTAYQKAKRLNERPPVMTGWASMVLGKEQTANVVPFSRSA